MNFKDVDGVLHIGCIPGYLGFVLATSPQVHDIKVIRPKAYQSHEAALMSLISEQGLHAADAQMAN